MKLFTLLRRISFSILFTFSFLHFSFGQNATNGGEIGITNPDTVFTATYFVGEVADTILNFTSPSGGSTHLDFCTRHY